MNTILLSNLIKIRWIAIIGQLSAILIVYLLLEIKIPLIFCLLALLASVIVNIFSYLLQKKDNTISNKQTFFFLLYDTFQLGILLFLTGGILNPFSILIIAPVIISATYLPALWTVSLSFFSILQIIFLTYINIPLKWMQDFLIPSIYNQGLIFALIITILFIAAYAHLFARSSREISTALSETKLQLSNQKKITAIGSLSAAAAHELSTPLNTIFLILDDFLKDKKLIKNMDILKDIELLKSEADRCKKILFNLSNNPSNLNDNFLKKIKISDIIKINFEKFNKDKVLKIINLKKNQENEIFFKDEIMYSLGNLIQNAINYSNKFVIVNIDFDDIIYKIKITDDGPGFSKDILDKLGQPYISKNNKGMGLGIFIAKNLIENLEGKINFYNSKKNNAVIDIVLNKSILLS